MPAAGPATHFILNIDGVNPGNLRFVEAHFQCLFVLVEGLLFDEIVGDPEKENVHEQGEDYHHEKELDILAV